MAIPQLLQDREAVVVCDYGAGALRGAVRDKLVDGLRVRPEMLVVVDAHQPSAWAELQPDLATPNALEAADMLGLKLDPRSDRAAVMAAHRDALLQATGANAVVVTLDR